MTTLPHPPGVGELIVASPDDLSMLSEAVEGGMAVHSTELILGGVLRQELDLAAYPLKNPFQFFSLFIETTSLTGIISHLLPVGGASSSDPTPSNSAMATGGRRKRKPAGAVAGGSRDTSSPPTVKRRRK